MSASSARRSPAQRWPSAPAWTMSLLFLGAAVRCIAVVFIRLDPGLTRVVVAGVAGVCLVVSVGVLRLGHRPPRRLAHVLLVLLMAVTSLLVATAPTRADAALSAFAYPWGCLYAAHFFTRRAAQGYAAVASLGFGAGVLGSGLSGMLVTWLMVTATVTTITFVTASLVAALRRQSETDPLTGVANRAGFHRLARQALALTARLDQSATVVVCDVDGLKAVNDSRGHAAGDELLAGFAAACRSVLRAGDVLARLGGDEFALLMPNSDDVGAHAMLQRLRRAAVPAFSAGVATWQVGEPVDTLLSRADAAMYACKTRTRGRSVVPEPRATAANLAVT